jgi:nitrate/TMAO reductase-like tetraheme cytochrome c subunit
MSEQVTSGSTTAAKTPSRLRRWLIRSAIVVGVLVIGGAALIGVAEHRTQQPQFCASCHIMEPYYATWETDVHGAKLDVACVDCHYAPGEKTTLKAKFRGLSQVASYFSGRYGAGRPRAYVSNLSCMTAQCHGDMKFMDKPLTIGTVRFMHSKHLNRDAELEKPHEARLAELEKTLQTLSGEQRFRELDAIAAEVGPGKDRYDRLAELAKRWDLKANREMLVEFSQLKHRTARIAQLTNLQCTSCHAYHATDQDKAAGKAGHHFQVTTTTCYTCHFNNEGFNTGTSECLKCHSPPRQDIVVHAEMKPPKDAGGDTATKLVKMNHAEILNKQVSCEACHADAIVRDATVTRRDCERCHDQARFFADWKQPYTLELVKKYHDAHVEQQRAKCLDCHSEIQHRLIRGTDEFLSSALANCMECHPNHHASQVNLLLGRGGTTVPTSTPNLMFGSRTNCTGCHGQIHTGEGGVAKTATVESCIACHGDRHKDTFEKWKLGLELSLTDAEQAFSEARKALDASKAPEDVRKKVAALLAGAEADLKMVKSGNGLHNVAYAIELLDAVTARSREAAEALGGK